ncbi:MAG: integration host factor subunit beta, partial [Candidatus Omnitrophica bacterium]|nr:integration host factor subunit beta [Candidatus Omnitrophota bacterium]
MNKRDIVVEVAQRPELSELTQAQIKSVIQSTLDYIVESLEKGRNIELRNFGVFKTKARKSRAGRNPRTGEKVMVPERRVAVFKPGLI